MKRLTNRAHATVGIAVILAGSLGLAACGESTVTSDDIAAESSSVEPLERDTESSENADKDKDKDKETSESTTAKSDSNSEPQAQDQAAREIDEIPESEAPATSPEDEDYLSALGEEDIDVNGLEDQLISTAWTVCADDPVANATSGAVGGQLVEQGRTELSSEEATRVVEEHAREIYCP
ncbi:hypothetical protein C3B44_10930 [Corynebacterium yudongzhengii]|uniref:DUF732 domain-containing protein n=1 Tax=Corynebacterium yudongzhengii TaxID=2080740 RepID=A0A2U1T843_9CORY|nr:DUF732 domain-containing protein [Corynebacterium yudongzhengii]AWB82781.1 hypothetical protein C3B44_10930 [Corynebacterium yudongzhengii]PWC02159.1 DUF732 domain-containing protein [Corynebacterium yudongzhengii]